MDSIQKRITKYLRDAVVSQKTQQIEITEESVKIQRPELEAGQIRPETCSHFFKPGDKQRLSPSEDLDVDIIEEKSIQHTKVIVAVQVVNVKAEGGVKHESSITDLTGTFFGIRQ